MFLSVQFQCRSITVGIATFDMCDVSLWRSSYLTRFAGSGFEGGMCPVVSSIGKRQSNVLSFELYSTK